MPTGKYTYIGTSPGRGRGVFALQDFKPNDLIEIAPVIPIPLDDGIMNCISKLDDYVLKWDGDTIAIGLGYSFLYNHSDEPNAIRNDDYINQVAIYRAIKHIKKDEEIFVKYKCDPWW